MTLAPDATVKDLFLQACDRNELKKVRYSLGLGANVNWQRDRDRYSGLFSLLVVTTESYWSSFSVSQEWMSTLLPTITM